MAERFRIEAAERHSGQRDRGGCLKKEARLAYRVILGLGVEQETAFPLGLSQSEQTHNFVFAQCTPRHRTRGSRSEGKMPPSIEIAVLLLGVLALETRRSASALHIQQAFPSPNQTNNFVVDPVSRKVYLATVNSVYQLNGTLGIEVEKRTGPVEDNLLCHAPQLPQAPCEHPKSLTDNYNKLLKLDREQGVVVVCGSVYQGFCELRKMDNISEIAVEFPPQGEKTVFPSMLNIAANHPNASTVGLILKSHGGNTRLLVGATYTGAGTQYFPKNHSKEDLRFENTPEIAIRSLNVKDLSRLFTYDINPSEDNVFKIKQEVKTKNKLNFVHAFIHKTYSYIAFNNDAKTGHKESQPNSILARICLDAENPRKTTGPEIRKLTESYIQMPLQCGYNGNIYNRMVSVYSADIHTEDAQGTEPYLFGVFSKERQTDRKSALCAFKFGDIEQEIRQGRFNCSNSPSSDVQVLDSVIQGSGAACVQKGRLVVRSTHTSSLSVSPQIKFHPIIQFSCEISEFSRHCQRHLLLEMVPLYLKFCTN